MVKIHIAKYLPTGKLIGIDEAEKGKNCNCVCYSCNGKLIAKKGTERTHHFAHYKNSTKDCQYSFWVVCRDLAKQIFTTQNKVLSEIILDNEKDYAKITRISTKDIKQNDINFDLSFFTQKYGRVYVYFITPEYQRESFSQYNINSISSSILLIDLLEAYSKKEKITEYLNNIIIHSKSKKRLLCYKKESTLPKKHTPSKSLFFEIEKEEKLKKLQLEIKKNTPQLHMYSEESFIKNLSKFDISLNKLDKLDLVNISKLDSIFISLIKEYGYEHNKSYIYKEVARKEKLNWFISFREIFFGIIILANCYVVYHEKDNTLIPVVVTPFKEAIPKKLSYVFQGKIKCQDRDYK